MRKYLFIIPVLSLITACGGTSPTFKSEIAQRLAAPSFMVKRQIDAQGADILSYERMHERNAPANIYIEGDGSLDGVNTPLNPVALHLSSRDKAQNLAWIAQPCQYNNSCDNKDTNTTTPKKNFNASSLSAFNAALDDIAARYNITGFNLIGFDGGGAIAAILAAQRKDVLSLRTVAGNLDHDAYATYHNIAIPDDTITPTAFADSLKKVPQYHFIGGQDKVISSKIYHSYAQALGTTNCVSHRFIQEAEHTEGWVSKWPELLALQPICKGPTEDITFDDYEFVEPIRIQRELPKGK